MGRVLAMDGHSNRSAWLPVRTRIRASSLGSHINSQSGSMWHSQQLDHFPDRRCGLLRGSRGCSDKSRSTTDQSLSRSLPRLFASLRSLLNCVVVSRRMDQSTLALRSSRLAYLLSPCPSRACPNASRV